MEWKHALLLWCPVTVMALVQWRGSAKICSAMDRIIEGAEPLRRSESKAFS